MSLNDLRDKCHQLAKEKGWWDGERPIPECLALIHSEVSEALEEYRNNKNLRYVTIDGRNSKPEGFPTEMADIIVRVLDLCGHLNIDIQDAFNVKMRYNEKREYRHGGKRA